MLNALGAALLGLGRPGAAVDPHETALVLARRTSARFPETEALLGLAAARHALSDHTQALDCAQQALAIARQAGYRILEGQARTALATACLGLADHDLAIEHARQALVVHRYSGRRGGEREPTPGMRAPASAPVPDRFDQATFAEYVRQSRAEQGFPPTIGDPGTLERVAALLADGVDYRHGAAQTRQ